MHIVNLIINTYVRVCSKNVKLCLIRIIYFFRSIIRTLAKSKNLYKSNFQIGSLNSELSRVDCSY